MDKSLSSTIQGFSLEIILSHVKLNKKPFLPQASAKNYQICKNLLSHLVTKLLFTYKSKYYEIIDSRIGSFLKCNDLNCLSQDFFVSKLRKFVKAMNVIIIEDIFTKENCSILSHPAKNWNHIAALNLVGCISVEVFYNSTLISTSTNRKDLSYEFAVYMSEAISSHICTNFKSFFDLVGGWESLVSHKNNILSARRSSKRNSIEIHRSWVLGYDSTASGTETGTDYLKPLLIAASLGVLGAIITLQRR